MPWAVSMFLSAQRFAARVWRLRISDFPPQERAICGYGDDGSFIRDRICVPIDGALVLKRVDWIDHHFEEGRSNQMHFLRSSLTVFYDRGEFAESVRIATIIPCATWSTVGF